MQPWSQRESVWGSQQHFLHLEKDRRPSMEIKLGTGPCSEAVNKAIMVPI